MRKFDISSPRAQLALRFFTYGVMAISTVILTVAAIFYAMGYRFNQGLIEQGGLVQVRSTPEGARVYVDTKRTDDDTPGRVHMTAGTHTVEMQLEGYHSWKRTVNVSPGQLLWLDYTRFIPSQLQTTPVRSFTSLVAMSPSPDHHWLLLQEKADSPTFILADVSNDDSPTFAPFTIPDTFLTKKDGAYGIFTVVEWAQDSRYFLVKHDVGGIAEYLRVDRTRPAETVNISTLFRMHVTDIHFAHTTANALYVKTDDILRRLDIPAANASAALVAGVQQFTVNASDVISFTATRDQAVEAGLYTNNKETIVRSFPAGHQPLVAYTEYYRHAYVAVSNAAGQVDILRDPQSTGPDTPVAASFMFNQNMAWLDFSDSGRMVIAASTAGWTVHDLELDKTYAVGHTQAADQPNPAWLDSFYLMTSFAGTVRFTEFDGQNAHDIIKTAPGFSSALSGTGKLFYSVGNTETGLALQATKLTIN